MASLFFTVWQRSQRAVPDRGWALPGGAARLGSGWDDIRRELNKVP